MFIKKSVLYTLAVLVVAVIIIEATVVARVQKAFVTQEYHGLLNGKVAQPYEEFVHELLVRYKQGDMDALGRALGAAGDRKYEMGNVWLNDDTPNAYRESVDQILK